MPDLQIVRKGGEEKKEENKTTKQERMGISHHTITGILMTGWWEIKQS